MADKRGPNELGHAEFMARLTRLRFRGRLDAVLIGMAFAVVLSLAAAVGFGIFFADQLGSFERPPIERLEDERLLTNIRGDLSEKPIMDGAMHWADGRMYLLQKDGPIHRYDPPRRLWSAEEPPPVDLLENDLLVSLRSGCGNDPLSSLAPDCPDPASLWALSADGGLLRKHDGAWTLIFGDSRFRDAEGQPVPNSALTSAAVSEDRRWLAVGAKDAGLGIYDRTRRHWLDHDPRLHQALPAPSPTHVLWWGDRFWVGTPAGLMRVRMRNGRPVPSAEVLAGKVLSLSPDGQQALWALLETDCRDQGDECLKIARFTRPDGDPDMLWDETNRYRGLNLDDLHFALFLEPNLYLAGKAGAFRYDADRHSWERLYLHTITATLLSRDRQGFFFAGKGEAGILPSNRPPFSIPNGETAYSLKHGREGEALLLTEAGLVYRLTRDGLDPVFSGQKTAIPPTSFKQAFSFGDAVLFSGSEGVMFHDTSTRAYRDIPNPPYWSMADHLQLVRSGARLFALIPDPGQTHARILDPAAVSAGIIDSDAAVAELPQAGSAAFKNWDDRGIAYLDNQDRVIFYGSGPNHAVLAGQELPGRSNQRILDAVADGNRLFLGLDSGIAPYRLNDRVWETIAPLPDGQRPLQIETFKNSLVARTDAGRLLLAAGQNPVLIGGEPFRNARFSDALEHNGRIYLAGAGLIEVYDPRARGKTQTFRLDGADRVDLKQMVGGTLLSTSGRRAYLDGARLVGTGAPVESLSVGDAYIWTVRKDQDAGRRFLEGHPKSNPTAEADCFFRNPSPGPNVEIRDARHLGDGRIAVATNQGLHFYHSRHRSWRAVQGGRSFGKGRLYVIDGHLILADRVAGSVQLRMASLSRLPVFGSCDPTPVLLPIDKTIEATAYAADENAGRLAWLEENGPVRQWSQAEAPLLETPNQGPPLAEARHIYYHSAANDLLLTNAQGLWRYKLDRRRWEAIAFNTAEPLGDIEEISLELDPNYSRAVVKNKRGDFFLGTIDYSNNDCTLVKIFDHDSPGTMGKGRRLLGVHAFSEALDDTAPFWLFLWDRGLSVYRPGTRQWAADIPFPQSDPSLTLKTFENRLVAVSERKRRWLVATEDGPTPNGFVRLDLENGMTYTLAEDGVVWRYADGWVWKGRQQGSGYQFEAVAKPFRLDPAKVNGAYDIPRHLNERVLFDEGGRLRVCQTRTGEEWPVAGADVNGIRKVFEVDGRLWILDRNELHAYRSRQLGLERVERLPAQAATWDREQRVWVRQSGRWRMVDREQEPAEFRRARHLTVTEDGRIFGIDSDDRLFTAAVSLYRTNAKLPQGIDASRVTSLLPGEKGAWWVLVDNRLLHLAPGPCPDADQADQQDASLASRSGCLIIAATVALPAEVQDQWLVAIQSDQGRPDFKFSNGAQLGYRDDARSGSSWVRVSMPPNSRQDALIPNQWSNNAEGPPFRDFMRTLAEGPAFDPVTHLEFVGARLLTRRPSGTAPLTGNAALRLKDAAPLEAGWLSWNGAAFEVRIASGGTQAMIPADFIDAKGRFLFEEVDALVSSGTGARHAVNRHGVWTFPRGDLGLNQPGIAFQPQSLKSGISGFAHGCIFTAKGIYSVNAQGLSPTALPPVIIDGALRFEERLDGVSAAYQRVDGVVARLDPNRAVFPWDQDRRGLAWDGDRLLIHSAAGVHPVAGYDFFDPGPSDAALARTARLRHEGSAYLQDGDSWALRDGFRWRAVGDPLADRVLLNDGRWTWRLEQYRLRVDPAAGPPIRVNPAGPAYFGSDSLRSAAAHDNLLFVSTDAFLEIADDPEQLRTGNTRREAALARDARLETLRDHRGSVGLYLREAGGPKAWLGPNFANNPISPDPFRQRRLVETAPLRMDLDNNRVSMALQVEDRSGRRSWTPMTLQRGRFPFDIVESLAVANDRLLAGTPAGLQIYDRLQTDLGQARLLNLGGANPAGPVGVADLGVPLDAPRTARVYDNAGACFQLDANGLWGPCSADTAAWLRVDHALWQWLRPPGGLAQGRYKADGQPTGPLIDLRRNRFPHDRVRDIAVWDNRAFTLWRSRWVSLHDQIDLGLSGGVGSQVPADTEARRFIKVDTEVELDGYLARRGLYLALADQSVLRYAAGKWTPVSNPNEARAILAYADRPPIFSRDRLRLLHPKSGGFVFEQRTDQGDWRPLPWIDGRVAIDLWDEFLFKDNQLWAATPAGLCRFDRPGQTAILDGDRFTLKQNLETLSSKQVRQARDKVTELDIFDGAVYARKQSGAVYVGDLSAPSGQAFGVAENDPFADQAQYSNAEDLFRWRRQDRLPGKPGRLEGWFRGAPLALSEGRFPFDHLSSLAVLQNGVLELASNRPGGAGGWRRAQDANLSLRRLERPQAHGVSPAEVTRIGLHVHDGRRYLRLVLGPDDVLRWRPDAAPEATAVAPEFQDEDGFWLYQKHEGSLLIRARNGLGGPGERVLIDGRFSDDIVIGLPATGGTSENPAYYIPSHAGVLKLGSDFEPLEIHAPPFPGVPGHDGAPVSPETKPSVSSENMKRRTPSALLIGEDGAAAYADAAALRELAVPRNAFQRLGLDLPDGVSPFQAEYGPQDGIWFRWRDEETVHRALTWRQGLFSLPANHAFIDVGNLEKYQAYRMFPDPPDPWLAVGVTDGSLHFGRYQQTPVALTPLPEGFVLLNFIRLHDRLLVIGSNELFEINLEKAMRDAFGPPGGSAADRPAGAP